MTIPDMPLPPLLRRWQQTWMWQVIGLPISVGFLTSTVTNGCLSHGIFAMDMECLKNSISATIVAFIAVLISGHSPNSPSFHDDGTPNKAVEQVAEITKPMAADTAIASVNVVNPHA